MIRTATAADLPAVVALWDLAGGPTRTPPVLADAERLFERDPASLLVVEVDGEVVATLIVGWDGWRCHCYRLVTHPDHRRRGWAAQLVEAAVARARALGASRVDAMVNDANDGARAFWASAGFSLEDHDSRWSQLVPPAG